MNKANPTGTIYLPTLSALCLWQHEITGQLSDGNWENSRPYDHWKFWCDLEAKLDTTGVPRVETNRAWECKKQSYALTALLKYVGDRMLNLGRMGEAAHRLELTSLPHSQARAAEHMPATLESFMGAKKERFASCPDWRRLELESLSTELVEAYYACDTYTMKALRGDLAIIKVAMKNLVGVKQ